MRIAAQACAAAWLAALTACGAAPMRVAALDEMDRVRSSADARQGARLAPEAYALAELERRIALDAHAAGDDTGAALHAERSVAAYAHARTVARLSRASAEQADAQRELDDTTSQLQTIEAERAQLDAEAGALEDRVRAARDRLLPAASAPATPEREQARRVAARALALDARLLCHAAHLVVPTGTDAASQDTELDKLDDRIARGPVSPSPIDDAARWRARCLDVLTRARRDTGDDASGSDALLAELSAAGGWAPVRDERGVMVTLHGPFQGPALAAGTSARLADLARVATAHKRFALQVVVHDVQTPQPKDETDARRGAAAIAALVVAGADATTVHLEQAGARAPLVDPRDVRDRARNERLDVVFVSTGK